MFLADQMPDIGRYQRAGEKVQVLYEYLYALRQNINHVLSNISEENLSADVKKTLQDAANAAQQISEQLDPKAAKVAAWPVGAVFMTADDAINPAEAIGGAWEQLDTTPMNGVIAWKRTE